MSDFPTVIDYSQGAVLSSNSVQAIGSEIVAMSSFFGTAAAWPSANLAIYIPLKIAYPFVATKMFWFNGTVGTDSVDVGIYDSQGNQLVHSGSTLTAGASSIQSVSITSITLQSGLFYLAMAMNGTTNTTQRANPVVPLAATIGAKNQSTAFPLPATATFATNLTAYIPFLAITSNSTI